MPTRHQLTAVARKLKTRLNGKAFLTMPRMEITELLRETSGEDTTRIKSGMADDLQIALLEQGIRCFPSIAATATGDTVRLFHAGTVLGNLVDLLVHPSTEADRDLGTMLTKIKGKWEWTSGA
jgi:hypothetical protein